MRKWNWGSQAIPSSVAAPTWSDTIIPVQLLFSGAIAQAAGGTAVRDIQIFWNGGLRIRAGFKDSVFPVSQGLGIRAGFKDSVFPVSQY
jgi:hypothetical protein